ncbi:universal stress protein UspE [Ferrimonas sediminicola]|uniref:Universal stress protein UspE n=1 Tax=Ferrimonas sediminicola TaxID=2569538 RepID=A0A4U1BI48_9GAMM|nr:universal stress protein UspE [Ferrimonas sediminicola]TKB50456.1 universal stress protein UspE [Ferrimonas sediminicola]
MSSERLLVVIDPDRVEQPALDRALHLARKTGAPITLFSVIFNLTYEKTALLSKTERDALRDGLIDKHHRQVEELVTPLQQEGLSVDARVEWHDRPFEAIIRYVLDNDVGYIIKSTQEGGNRLSATFFTPTDWHLIRKAPVPVLMVKEHDWPKEGKILAAIDIDAEDEVHRELNERIIQTCTSLAKLVDAQVHLVNGYPGLPDNLFIEQPEFNNLGFNISISKQHQEHLEELGAKHGIAADHCHARQGDPEEVIVAIAQDLDAELVVLGTIGEQGITATLLGSTAEHVIYNIGCDLLALKPSSFESPLA